jgi:thiol-disulfide isomerase/thioredoxin
VETRRGIAPEDLKAVALRMRSPLPSLEGAAAWVDGGVSAEELRERPVVVSFWSISCHLCHESAELVAAWREKFAQRGVAFVAVHQPRSADELDIDAVRRDAIDVMGLKQPCAIDNSHAIVDRFQNEFVPAFYIFNGKHELRHFQAGGKGFERIEAALERILDERDDEGESSEADTL